MSYSMEYIVADAAAVTLGDVTAALGSAGAGYGVDGEDDEATIQFRGNAVGHLKVYTPGDGVFDDYRPELIELAEAGEGSGKARVLDALRSATSIIHVQVLFGDGDYDHSIAALEPLWRWLEEHRRGVRLVDGREYYDRGRALLKV